MDSAKTYSSTVCHVVGMPFPGRGHLNPMMNLCKLLALKRPQHILVTFVVTEEWLGFIGSDPKPANFRFNTIPNVIPSELGRGKDWPAFVEAVNTKMESPFEELLDRLEPPVTAIVADTYLPWAIGVGNRRNIPVASLWPMPATVFSVFHHFELVVQHGHFPIEVSERGDELVDYIPGVSATHVVDLPTFMYGNGPVVLHRTMEGLSSLSKAQYLIFASIHELESEAIDTLKAKLPFPVYPIGPTIPYFELQKNSNLTDAHTSVNYFRWLDSQPTDSVLYISFGSFIMVSSAQIDEIIGGLQDSGVRYLLVSRGEANRPKDTCCGDMGLVVPWCEQLKVLCHPSVGGFLTHCGWNSTLESAFAGVPMLTFPIFWDQIPNSKWIVEDWKVGWRVKKDVTRGEISKLVKRFMDQNSNEGNEMRKRAKELQEVCRGAIVDVKNEGYVWFSAPCLAACQTFSLDEEKSKCQTDDEYPEMENLLCDWAAKFVFYSNQ
ncbi:UDP-glycosyltransferase 87A1-like [Corylus avellana]|uniref:UDP-glycosyltransferase 87A1-like n=1 Tax=Corylus avellana TaxID=13451 RepID=UPI00286BAE27|nr:UDP-glycosyltransferase 87A1-like [Corylus avellana]